MPKKSVHAPYRPVSSKRRRPPKGRGSLARRGKLVLGGVLLWLAYLFLGGDYGLLKIVSLKREIGHVEQEISVLRAKKAALKRECDLLQGDPSTIERVARERLGMTKD